MPAAVIQPPPVQVTIFSAARVWADTRLHAFNWVTPLWLKIHFKKKKSHFSFFSSFSSQVCHKQKRTRKVMATGLLIIHS